MNLDIYKAFIRLAETGNLTKTALDMGYTQSAMSHILKVLEKECQMTLMTRDQKGARLTSAGKELLPYIKAVCARQDALRAKIDELNGLEAGCLRIGSFFSVSACWLPEILKDFHTRYPNVRFELKHGEYGEIEKWTLTGETDCGFLTLPADPRLAARLLKRDHIVAVVPKGHPLALNESVTGKELLRWPFIRYEDGSDTEIRDVLANLGIEPEAAISVKDDYTVISMVEHGLGVSILPALLFKDNRYQVVIKELCPVGYRDIALAYQHDPAQSPLLNKFLEMVSDKMLEI